MYHSYSSRAGMVAECCNTQDARVQSMLQVLTQLPEGLALAVLAASTAGLEHQLDTLPGNLHHFAIEAAFPSIHHNQSLTLAIDSTGPAAGVTPSTAHAVLQAVHYSCQCFENTRFEWHSRAGH
jgi:hypothetical protein